ncbi:MAG: Rpn family recombination-promoting nuclease/putative transposase [Clostridia bacterium]|nr:Rpn family recombination-promoting nuclease/putative transposase [Clostridia bacterium]
MFGYVGNEEITKGLISSIIQDIEITNIELDLKEITSQDLKDDKFGILDIRAELNNSIKCNIEMQIIDRKDIENRIMFYWSKLYGESIKVGERYINAKRTIIILFTDYEIKGHEKIKKYISKWQIREEEYKEIILTKNLEIYIIELPKCERYKSKSKELNTWVKFIRKPEEIDMEDMNNNKALKKAKEVLEEISGDEREKELAFQRLMYKMDQEAIEVAGYDRGIERGIEQGIQQGMEEIAKRMLKDNLDIEFIMQYTGLTKEEIEKLK